MERSSLVWLQFKRQTKEKLSIGPWNIRKIVIITAKDIYRNIAGPIEVLLDEEPILITIS